MGLTRISEGSPCFSFPFLHQVTSFFLFFFFTFLFHRWLFPLPHRSERFFSSLCRACSVIESVTRNSNTWENEGKMENKPLPLALPPPETHFERFFLFLKNATGCRDPKTPKGCEDETNQEVKRRKRMRRNGRGN